MENTTTKLVNGTAGEYLTLDDRPFFAECDYFGTINNSNIPAMNYQNDLYHPAGITMQGAIEYLIGWIKENPSFVYETPAAKYSVYFQYLLKNGKMKSKTVFSINGKDAVKYILKSNY